MHSQYIALHLRDCDAMCEKKSTSRGQQDFVGDAAHGFPPSADFAAA
jgi:hypothetical protein